MPALLAAKNNRKLKTEPSLLRCSLGCKLDLSPADQHARLSVLIRLAMRVASNTGFLVFLSANRDLSAGQTSPFPLFSRCFRAEEEFSDLSSLERKRRIIGRYLARESRMSEGSQRNEV